MNPECRFVLWKEGGYFQRIGKRLTERIAEQLIKKKKVKLKDCQSMKTGKKYNATVILETETDGSAKFRMEFEKGGGHCHGEAGQRSSFCNV